MLNPNEFVVITTQEAYLLRQALDFLANTKPVAGIKAKYDLLGELGVLDFHGKACELERLMQETKDESH